MDTRKWADVRRKASEIQSTSSRQEDSVNIRILNSLKPFSAKGRQLFEKSSSSSLPPYQQKYNSTAFSIKKFIEGKEAEIGMEAIIGWFPIQYRLIFGHDCIDFNRFYAIKTFQNLVEYLEMTHQQLAYTIHKWMFSYSMLGYDEYQKSLTISTLRTPWIVENLITEKLYRGKTYL